MAEKRATTLAPLVIYPVALVFIAARAWILSDPRELLVSPITAAVVAFIGYPLAASSLWLGDRLCQRDHAHRSVTIVVTGVIVAEVLFWGLVSPFWQRDFSAVFCAMLVGSSGLATAWLFLRLQTGNPLP